MQAPALTTCPQPSLEYLAVSSVPCKNYLPSTFVRFVHSTPQYTTVQYTPQLYQRQPYNCAPVLCNLPVNTERCTSFPQLNLCSTVPNLCAPTCVDIWMTQHSNYQCVMRLDTWLPAIRRMWRANPVYFSSISSLALPLVRRSFLLSDLHFHSVAAAATHRVRTAVCFSFLPRRLSMRSLFSAFLRPLRHPC